MTPALAPAISLSDTARAVGLAPETFRKAWRRMVADMAFPRPIRTVRPITWRPEPVAAWLAGRERAGIMTLPANEDDRPREARQASVNHIARLRAEAARRMAGAR